MTISEYSDRSTPTTIRNRRGRAVVSGCRIMMPCHCCKGRAGLRWLVVGRTIVFLILFAHAARAEEIPIVTLSDAGANQDIPVHRSFYVAGDAPASVQSVQAILVRKGSPGIFGDDGGDCHGVIADLRIEPAVESAGDDDDDSDDDTQTVIKYPAGVHTAYEVFPRAAAGRDAAVLVTARWKRSSPDARDYKVFVPHDADFFAPGYGYCLAIVTTERAQAIDDSTLSDMVDAVAHKIVACGDKSSCDDDALADHEARAGKLVPKQIAAHVKEEARAELATTPGLVEALDHLRERWHDKTLVLSPGSGTVWGATATDPFAGAVATMLARSGALLPQVRGKGVTLFTTDGKLEVRALQLLDDGRSIRVAASASPSEARVLTATADTLAVADGITLFDLVQLGQGKLRVDKDWTTLSALGDKAAGLGSESWTADDAAYLASAGDHLRRLANFVDIVTTGASCTASPQEGDVVRKLLGEWLVCQHVDAGALESLVDQLDELQGADAAWKATKDKVFAHDRQLVTLTTTTVADTRAERAPRTWLFSYVTPVAGYAGILRPDESFGLFYVGAEIHLAPNPVDAIQWKRGSQDLLRAVALELGVAPYSGSFGPEHRYGGLGALPPVFVGVAFHAIPYSILERRNSTIPEERTHTTFAPYLGFAVQLNLPDLIYQAVTR
jgi:hypothetical protein